MSHSQFHCSSRVDLDMHGLDFETSICYWQDQPGRLGYLYTPYPSAGDPRALSQSDNGAQRCAGSWGKLGECPVPDRARLPRIARSPSQPRDGPNDLVRHGPVQCRAHVLVWSFVVRLLLLCVSAGRGGGGGGGGRCRCRSWP